MAQSSMYVPSSLGMNFLFFGSAPSIRDIVNKGMENDKTISKGHSKTNKQDFPAKQTIFRYSAVNIESNRVQEIRWVKAHLPGFILAQSANLLADRFESADVIVQSSMTKVSASGGIGGSGVCIFIAEKVMFIIFLHTDNLVCIIYICFCYNSLNIHKYKSYAG